MNEKIYFKNEPERERETKSLKNFLKLITQKISEGVKEFLEKKGEDPDIEKFKENLTKSIELSKAAGEYFKFLIPKSLGSPELGLNSAGNTNDGELLLLWEKFALNKLKQLQEDQSIEKKLYNLRKRSLFEIAQGIANLEVYEKQEEDCVAQTRRFVYQKNNNTLKESVANYLWPEKSNTPTSCIVYEDSRTDLKLDFDALLPDKVFLAPSKLIQYKEKIDENTKDISYEKQNVNLHDYKGNEETGRFAYLLTPRYITYGNLVERGGLFSLLHEIAHSWQDVYDKSFGRSNFEEFYKEICQTINVLCIFLKLAEDQKSNSRHIYKELAEQKKAKLLEMGVEVVLDSPKLNQRTNDFGEGEYKIRDSLTDRISVIKSDKINDLAKDYTKQERDAWAHAIRILRFLRERGVDLEPELKTFKDFKEYIDKYLGSYQEYLDEIVKFGRDKVRFTGRSSANKPNAKSSS